MSVASGTYLREYWLSVWGLYICVLVEIKVKQRSYVYLNNGLVFICNISSFIFVILTVFADLFTLIQSRLLKFFLYTSHKEGYNLYY